MAVNTITFGGVTSSTYDIYISGEGVFNAPKRSVEMLSVPGKNGDLTIDQGSYENIEVVYPAHNFEKNMTDFTTKLRNFRNALASKNGYQRLTDTFHTDEYRLGVFADGLEVDPIKYNTASQFNIKFNCKPQRFLTSGEVPITMGTWSDVETETGPIVSFDADVTTAIKDITVAIEPVQSGSGTPSPDNPRPISGHTDAVVVRTNENLAGDDGHQWNINSSGKIESNNQYDATVFKVVSGQKYTITFDGSGDYRAYAFFEHYPKVGDTCYGPRSVISTSSVTATAPIDGWCVARPTIGEVVTKVNKGETALATAEDTEVKTISLGTTVYKGTLDVTTGVLTVTHKLTTLTGASGENWSKSSNSTYDIFLFYDANQLSDKEYYCNRFMATTQTNKDTIGWVWQGSSNHQFRFCYGNHSSMTADDFKTWVSSNNIQLVTELATPTTTTLTAQQIAVLLGENNMWASTGDITVQYGTSSNILVNPTPFASKPLIKVTGYGTLNIGDYVITITGVAAQEIYIDCESMEIYKIVSDVPTSAASLVSFSTNEFPEIKEGVSVVSYSGNITAVEITPKWWRV